MKSSRTRHVAATAMAALMLAGCFGKSADQFLTEAKAQIADKNRDAAVIQLKNALQKDGQLAEARFLLGELLLEGGDARGAAIELTKAADLGYAKDRVVPLMARSLVAQGQLQDVLTRFADTALEAPSAQADLLVSLATAYGGMRQTARAQEAIQAAIAADPSNERAQLVRVRLVTATGTADEAKKALDELLAQWPKSSEAWQLKAEMLGRTGDADGAMKAYREAIALNKGNVAAQSGLMSQLLAAKDLDGATAQLAALREAKAGQGQILLFSALLSLERKDLAKARESVQVLLKSAPNDVRVLHLAGVIEFRRGALLEAENYLNKALQSAPGLVKARVMLAQTNLRQGDATKALSVLQPLLGGQGGDAEAYALAAEAYLQTGESKRAEEYFAKAAALNPKDPRSRVALALSEVAKGRQAEGIATLRSIAAADRGVTADMGLVTAFLQKRDWEQALKAVDGLEAKMPDRPTAANLRGRIEMTRGNREAARRAFEGALKIDPVFFPATASLAALDLADKKPEAAKARFQKILEANPNSVQANMAMIALGAQAGSSKDEQAAALAKLVKQMPTEAAPHLALVEAQLQRKDLKAAMAAAQNAVAALPENGDAWRLLAQTQALSGDLNQAISSINKWSAIAPKAPEPQMMLAEIYARQGDKAAQVQSLKRSLAIKADFQPARLALFASELSAGHYPEARKIADAVQAGRGGEVLGKVLSADINAAQKNWAAATTEYRAALKAQPVPDVAVKLHRVLGVAGKAAEAKAFEAEWMAAHPQDIIFIDYLGSLALAQQDFALAVQRYEAVLKIQPNSPLAANNLAWLLNKTGKPGAQAYAEKANQLVPDQPAFMDTLAQIYADSGQVDKALDVQKRAVKLAPEFAPHRLHLARYYVAAGQKSEARAELSKLAALGDKFAQQSEVAKLLGTL